MSYNFALDHTLKIEDIHDIITIDIIPEYDLTREADYVNLKGNVNISGTFLTFYLEEEPFNGAIPIDITLPVTGRTAEIRPEIVNFDYEINTRKSLMLTVEMLLHGYDAMTTEPDKPEQVRELVAELVAENVVIPEPAKPALAEVEAIEVEEPVIAQTEEIEEAMPTIAKVETIEATDVELTSEEAAPPVSALLEKTAEEISTPVTGQSSKQNSMFSMLEELDEVTSVDAEQSEEELVPTIFEHVAGPTAEQEEIVSKFSGNDSVARQFADGECIIKLVLVKDEDETLASIVERYEAQVQDVINLHKLESMLAPGDCVMIKHDAAI